MFLRKALGDYVMRTAAWDVHEIHKSFLYSGSTACLTSVVPMATEEILQLMQIQIDKNTTCYNLATNTAQYRQPQKQHANIKEFMWKPCGKKSLEEKKIYYVQRGVQWWRELVLATK